MSLRSNGTLSQYSETNVTATARRGTTVTAGTPAHTKNSTYATLLTTAYNSWGLTVRVADTAASATVTSYLVDIAIGGAGSEIVIVPNINAWGATLSGGRQYFFPVFVPTGTRISATAQSVVAGKTCTVAIWTHALCDYPEFTDGFVSLGANLSTSAGTSFTPAVGAYGTAALIGTTASDLEYWTCGMDGLADTTQTGQDYNVLVGANEGGTFRQIGLWSFSTDASENIIGPIGPQLVYFPVPSGTQIYASVAAGTTEARGLIVYGG